MLVACPSCQKSVRLDDARVPAGPFTLKCPGCGTPISVRTANGSPAPEPPPKPIPMPAPEPSAGFPAEEGANPPGQPAVLEPGSPGWERLKREVAHHVLWSMGLVKTRDDDEEDEEGKKHALICEDEAIFQQAIAQALTGLRFRVETAPDKKTALELLSAKPFDLVTVDNRLPDDPEGGTQILQAINALPPDQRRKMFVAFISADLGTMDTQSAFVLGANLTVGKKDLRRLDKILHQAIREHDRIYNIFRSVQEELQHKEA